MIRCGFLLVSLVVASSATTTRADDATKPDDSPVIEIARSAGFAPPTNPLAHYGFKVAKDGFWEFKSGMNEPKKGKISADDLAKWVKEIEDAGFAKLKSNPSLGAADEPFMDITIQIKDKKEQKRIPLGDKLAQAIEKKIIEIAKPGK